MDVLVINHREVRELLPMADCIAVLEQAFVTLAQGDAVQPLRWPLWLPDRSGLLGMMPGYVGGEIGMMGIKTVTVMPGNHGTEYDSHQGTVMLFEREHGVLRAVIDAGEITAIRTAATSGVATKALARPDASDLAIVGSGVQARSHLAAMLAVRSIDRIRVTSPNQERLQRYVAWAKAEFAVDVEAMANVESAVSDADIICTTTSAREPVLYGDWVAPGAHINAVGSSVPHARELDTAAVVRSRLYVDWRESTVNESGDYLIPLQEGAIDESHIVGEVGEVLLGRVEGRQSPEEITLFNSLGLAIEDIAAAHLIYTRAIEENVGRTLEIGRKREY